MKKNLSREASQAQANELVAVSQRILRYANRGSARIDFLTEISRIVLEFAQCDALELRLKDPSLSYRWEFTAGPDRSSRFTVLDNSSQQRAKSSEVDIQAEAFEDLCIDLVEGGPVHPEGTFLVTKGGSLWTRGLQVHNSDRPRAASGKPTTKTVASGPETAFALLRFTVDDQTAGLLQLKSPRENPFTEKKVELYEGVAQLLGLAIANRRAEWSLRERVKELTCLYQIGRIAQLRGTPLEELLQHIVELLPPAWQLPEIACAHIVIDGRSFTTAGFRQGPHRQAVDLIVQGSWRGLIEIVYTEDRLEFAAGPFLLEERSLLETVAREVALIVERRQGEEDQLKLQAQLRHADRLATIGQLAAGVAHELNEPLGNILGFAQLMQKTHGLPKMTAADVDKIVKASLHAREVIHKLLVFSRQKTPVKAQVDLNRVVQEGLYFLESRCARAGIQVFSILAQDLPEIHADASQLHQVLVNLVVNSIQAMPEGGALTIETTAAPDFVSLRVLDTGCGMSDEVKEKIFTPFFTTKDVDQGTGLGLAVVHGIISAHGGSILVESAPGKGTRFEVRLPRGGKSQAKDDD